MEYGIATDLFLDRDLRPAIVAIARAGFKAVEIWGAKPHLDASDPAFDVREVLRTLRREGVRAKSIHAPYGPRLDLGNEDPEVRAAGLEGFRRLLEPFAMLGGEVMVIHPNHSWADQTAEGASASRRRSRESLARAGDFARPYGLTVAVENMIAAGAPRPGATAADLVEMIADCPDNVGICLDTGHAFLNGRDPAAEVVDAGSHLVALHVHDNDGESDRHWPPGRGRIDWPRFLQALRTAGFGGAWTLEIMARGGEDVDAVMEEIKAVAAKWGAPAGSQAAAGH